MKIQIIYLDPEDDHASARDKLNSCQAQRAALVWPSRGRILTRRLDLELLDRHARNLGVQIGLITHDPTVRQHALTIAIPTFDTLDDASQETWRHKAKPIPHRERDRIQIRESLFVEPIPSDDLKSGSRSGQWVFGVLGLLALLVLATALLPSARVVLLPESELQVLELDVTLDPEAPLAINSGIIPSSREMITIAGGLSCSTSSYTSVPTEYASGAVEFTNLSSEPITIPSATGVRTTGETAIRFQTTEVASLPGGPDTTTLVPVKSLEPGRSGNVAPDSILAIEGLLGLEVSVRNPEPTTGGLERLSTAVSEADHTRLQQDLTETLLASAEAAFATELDEGQMLVTESLIVSRVISQQFDHAVGEAATVVGLTMELEITGLAFLREDLESGLLRAMEDELADGWQGIPGSLMVGQMGEGETENDGSLTFSVIANQQTYEAIDRAALASRLQWQSPQQASTIIRGEDSLSVEEISISPSWFPRLPLLSIRIAVLWEWEVE